MARAIDSEVPNTPGKKALAMEGFARALRALPAIIADNGGFDASELVTRLRAAHARGQDTAGLDMVKGDVADMTELGIRESFKSKLHVLVGRRSREMILRVDDIVKCAPRKREGRSRRALSPVLCNPLFVDGGHVLSRRRRRLSDAVVAQRPAWRAGSAAPRGRDSRFA